MKLLLTSSGLRNEFISSALIDLANKKPEEIICVFIPTAANMEDYEKGWLIDDLYNIKK